MALKKPKSMDECLYFTNRSTEEKGKIKAWVFKQNCTKCNKALMGKPRDPKTGRPKIRSKEYVCPSCGDTIEKQAYEETLNICVEYTCPHCNHKDELETQYKRKKVQIFKKEKNKKVSIDSIRFQCSKCGENIDITKKMK
jgi:predicted RNA-binding Zn-ribbon protein involved in translation (DUF1610 family)